MNENISYIDLAKKIELLIKEQDEIDTIILGYRTKGHIRAFSAGNQIDILGLCEVMKITPLEQIKGDKEL